MVRIVVVLSLLLSLPIVKGSAQSEIDQAKKDSIALEEHLDSLYQLYVLGYRNELIPLAKNAINMENDRGKRDLLTGRVYYLVGVSYILNTFLDTAETYAQKAYQVYDEINQLKHPAIIDCYNLLGTIYRVTKNFTACIEYQTKAYEIALQRFGDDHNNTGIIANNLGITYLTIKEYSKSEYFLEKALRFFENTKDNNRLQLVHIYTNLANTLTAKENYLKARKYYDMAISFQANNPKIVETSLLYTYMSLGDLEFKRKNYRESIKAYDKGLKLFLQLTNRSQYSNEAQFYLKLAKAYFKINEQTLARENLDKGFKILNYSFNQPYSFEGGETEILFNGIQLVIQQVQEEYQSTKLSHYADSLAFLSRISMLVLEELENKALTKKDMQEIIETSFSAYEKAMEIFLEVDPHSEELFKLSEISKSKLIFQFSNYHNYSSNTTLINLLDQKRKIQTEIARLETDIHSNKSNQPAFIDNKKEDLFKQQIELQSVLDSIQSDFPDYFQFNLDNKLMSPNELQQKLKSKESIVEYFVGEKNIYIFLISRREYKVFTVALDFNLQKLITQLRESIYSYWIIPGEPDDKLIEYNKIYCNAAYQLYLKLWFPIEPYTSNKVLIIPDGPLNLIPFEVLLSEEINGTEGYNSFPFLFNRHTFNYDYSAVMHFNEKRKNTRPNKNLFASFAPEFQNTLRLSNTRSIVDLRENLGMLKYNIEEASKVSNLLKGDFFAKENATKQSFLEQANNYRIIHLATHGKASHSKGDFSYIAFTPNLNYQDNLLYTRELFDLDLDLDMLVLSACETGLGEFKRGEGIVGIAKGFSYAGAKSTVTTLWSIYDHPATVNFMESFYTKLKAGMPKDEALRATKFETLANPATAAPYFWAGFISIGDMSPIQFSKEFAWWYYALGAMVLLLIGYFLIRNRQKT